MNAHNTILRGPYYRASAHSHEARVRIVVAAIFFLIGVTAGHFSASFDKRSIQAARPIEQRPSIEIRP
jgi:hypothetical protein